MMSISMELNYDSEGGALQESSNDPLLQSATGEELRPFREAGRTLSSSPSEASGIPSAEAATIGRAFKGELCPPSRPFPQVAEADIPQPMDAVGECSLYDVFIIDIPAWIN